MIYKVRRIYLQNLQHFVVKMVFLATVFYASAELSDNLLTPHRQIGIRFYSFHTIH